MVNNNNINDKGKYFRPSINIEYILMEDKITATSAYIIPGPESGNIQETWTDSPDIQKDFIW